MKIEAFAHIWDTDEETNANVFSSLKAAVNSYLESSLWYAETGSMKNEIEDLRHKLSQGASPETILEDFREMIAGWETDTHPFFQLDTHKIESYKLDIPVNVYVMVEGGVVQGASSDQPEVGFEVFDADNKKADGSYEEEIQGWEELMKTLHPVY